MPQDEQLARQREDMQRQHQEEMDRQREDIRKHAEEVAAHKEELARHKMVSSDKKKNVLPVVMGCVPKKAVSPIILVWVVPEITHVIVINHFVSPIGMGCLKDNTCHSHGPIIDLCTPTMNGTEQNSSFSRANQRFLHRRHQLLAVTRPLLRLYDLPWVYWASRRNLTLHVQRE